MNISCWSCGSVFVPSEMDHVPFFRCVCGAMVDNPVFGRKGFGRRFKGGRDWHTHSRNVGSL